jgi:hypothetical protein
MIPQFEKKDKFSEQVHNKLNGVQTEDAADFESWSPETVKTAYQGFAAQDQAERNKQHNLEIANAFVANHEEYRDSNTNGQIMNNQIASMFGPDRAYSLEQYEQAYRFLRERTNFLDLDKSALKRQETAKGKKRYADEVAAATPLTEAELETMDLEDLKRLTIAQYSR